MNTLRACIVAGIGTFVIGCGQSSTNVVSKDVISIENATSNTHLDNPNSQLKEVRFKPVSLNRSESAIYIPSESESAGPNLSEFALNGTNEFDYADNGMSDSIFQIDTTSTQSKFEGYGTLGQ